ncbi:MAG TPA: CbtB domain-containing protein [Spongiibacteraceae bacterium]|nr:CbtB domain-containing protein [Spongiibacteraceae bacterium]
MTTQTTTVQSSAVGVVASSRSAAFGAMLLGTAMIFLVGFAPIPAVHNAAHDTRHSSAFPCH